MESHRRRLSGVAVDSDWRLRDSSKCPCAGSFSHTTQDTTLPEWSIPPPHNISLGSGPATPGEVCCKLQRGSPCRPY